MSKPKVTVIDYGVGNLLSVQRGLEQCGADVLLTSDPADVLVADRLVLPGVGAFGNAMKALNELGLSTAIKRIVKSGVPLLGICLGMQLLFEESEEFGLHQGLGLIPGCVKPIPSQTLAGQPQKIPHIGWVNLLPSSGWTESILRDMRPHEAVYFVHSFMAVPDNLENVVAHCVYGDHLLSAGVRSDSVFGCQFHPEKSGKVGLKMLERFCVD
jgi:glutamine amidotransferase